MQLTLYATRSTLHVSLREIGASSACLPGQCKPDVLRPDIARVRGFMAIGLRQSMT